MASIERPKYSFLCTCGVAVENRQWRAHSQAHQALGHTNNYALYEQQLGLGQNWLHRFQYCRQLNHPATI